MPSERLSSKRSLRGRENSIPRGTISGDPLNRRITSAFDIDSEWNGPTRPGISYQTTIYATCDPGSISRACDWLGERWVIVGTSTQAPPFTFEITPRNNT